LAEYAILVAIVGLVLFGMSTYMRRGIQGTIKGYCDQLGSQQVTTNSGKQAQATQVIADSKSGSFRTQIFTGGAQTRDFNTRDTSIGSSDYVNIQ